MERNATASHLPVRSYVISFITLLTTVNLLADENNKPRVFITESQSWEVSGGLGGSDGGFGGAASGGARPQTAEIIKTVGSKCSTCIVTANKEKADYVLLLQHEGGKDPLRKDNKFAVFNKDGDVIESGATRSLGNAVKDACLSLMEDWKSQKSNQQHSAASGEKINSETSLHGH